MGLSTGDANTDIYLEGGIPSKSNLLLISKPGIEKTVFSLQFVFAGLKEGDKCVYITTDHSPEAIISMAKKYGWDVSGYLGKQLFFIDCYSWTLGQKGIAKKDGIIQVLGPSALNDISIELSTLVEDERSKRIIFHSLSTFLLNNPSDALFKFIQVTGARLKSTGASTLYLVDLGMHEERTIPTIQHLMDDTLMFVKDEEGWTLSAKSISYSKGLRIEFDNSGVRAP